MGDAAACTRGRPWPHRRSGVYGAELARFPTVSGLTVVDVNRPDRRATRAHGKTDPIDAYAVATAALSDHVSGTPKSRNGIVEAISALRVVRKTAASIPDPRFLRPHQRHRINRGGAWHANSALCTVVLVRMHYDSRTRDHVARHTAEGMSSTDVIRSLKGSSPARSTGTSKPPASRLRRPPEQGAQIVMDRCAGQAKDSRPETCRTGGRPGRSRGTRPARHPG